MSRWTRTCATAISCFALVCTFDASAQTARDGKVRILGRATIEAVPDYAMVRVGISNKASTPTAALDQNSAIARKIIDFTKGFGIDEQDLRTEAVNLMPATRSVKDASGGFRQEPDGYTATNTVRVKLTNLSQLGTYMRQVLDHGATNISGVQFGLSNSEQVAEDARAKAVENAIQQAKRLADAAKIRLGPIQEIVYPPRVRVPREEFAADMPIPRIAVPIEVGTVRMTAEVDMTWAIE